MSEQTATTGPPYKTFKRRHPEYLHQFWSRCRSLYEGGRALLEDDDLMGDIFPRHRGEEDGVYAERKRRACYIPYAGEIIDQMLAYLMGEPITLESEPEADPFYALFVADVSQPGGTKQSLNQLLRETLLNALLFGRAWTLVDLPPREEDALPQLASLADEEKAGLLRAYALPLDPEAVINWAEAPTGELLWALTRTTGDVQPAFDVRPRRREEYTHYTPTQWTRFVYEFDPDKPPKEDQPPIAVTSGPLSFQKVPLVPFKLPAGLWVMNKIESIVRAHFNLRNALTWGELKSLFPILTAGLAPPGSAAGGVPDPKAEDQNRAVNQPVGPGRVMVLSAQDKLEYVGPDSAPYQVAREDCQHLRDEMHRVVVQMAQSVDNSGAALQRSAESKQVDQSSMTVLLRAYGQYAREHAVDILEMAQRGRGEPPTTWTATGMEKFDEASTDALVVQAEKLELISIPSATFQVERKFTLAKRLLGDVEPEVLDKVRRELEASISAEQFQAPSTLGDDAAADDDDPTPPKLPKGKAKRRPGE